MANSVPIFLKQGDKVMFVATARKVSRIEMQPAVEVLQSWGLQVLFGENLFAEDNQFAGTDSERLSDLQKAFDHAEIKAIFCARGGYGTPRIIDSLNWTQFRQFPKWIIGFSDVTILLNEAQNQGICSLHAPMLLFLNKPEYAFSIERLKRNLFGEILKVKAQKHQLNRNGISNGILVGGNISLIVNSIGTKTAFDPNGKILFLEDIDEYLYHIDRMMLHLKRAGILEKLAGLVIGHFSEMKDNAIPFGETAYEIIARNVAEYAFPVAFGFPIGHETENLPLVVGANYKLVVSDKEATLEIL